MNATQPNVVNLGVKNPYTTILSFLDYKGDNNGTRVTYQKDIEDFFSITKNKKINQLTIEDLDYTMQDVVGYRKTLQKLKDKDGNKKYKAKSINKKMSVIYNLFCYFKSNEYDVNPYAFKLRALSEKDSKEADAFTWEEVQMMIEQVKSHPRGLEKSILIEVAATTSIRLTALVNLTWGNIIEVNGIKVIEVYDKGNKLDEKPIQDCLYQKLLQLKGENVKESDRIFSLTTRSYQDTITQLVKELGWDSGNRKLTFHSLKKSGVTRTYELTNDFERAREQGNHTNPQTTTIYIKRQKDYTQMGSYLIGEELDENILDEMRKDDLLDLIKSNKGIMSALIRMAKEGK